MTTYNEPSDYDIEVDESCVGVRHLPTNTYVTLAHLEAYGTVEDDDCNVIARIPQEVIEAAYEAGEHCHG